MLNPSALELLRPSPELLAYSEGVVYLKRPSIEVVLNSVPAVSKILRGKSVHLIQFSFIKLAAVYLLWVFGSTNLVMTCLASRDIVSGHFIYTL